MANETTHVVAFDKDYEEELKKTLGEAKYNEICKEIQGTKPIKACQIAQNETLPIPEKIQKAIDWLSS